MTTDTAPATPQPATPDAIRRIFTATLIIGVSGSGKTSLFATYARYLWETYGKVLFLYSWDGGAIPTEVQKCMKQGLIRFWRVRTRSAPGLGIETLYKATKGYVPKQINPETGETSPAVQMVPPVMSKYSCYCPQGHQLLVVPVQVLIQPTYCTQCKALIGREMMTIKEDSRRTKGLELIGGVGFDGLTSMSTVVMDHMDHARGAGDIGGEKPAFGGVVVSGDVKLGGNNRADVGFGQSRAQQFVNNSLSIPFLVEGPVFTALSAEAAEEGLPIVGAKLPGRAATDEASSWFGNVCEASTWNNPENGEKHRILYLRPFTDSQNRKHLLKTGGSPHGIPDSLLDPPEKEKRPFEQFNLGLVFKMLDDDLRKAVANQPILTTQLTDYGDAVTVEEPQKQPALDTGAASTAIAPPAGGVAAPAPATSGVAIPKPRSRARAGAPVAPAPTSTNGPVASQPVETPAAAAPATPAASAPTTGAPPPPPGARPPQRAPGA